MSSFILLLGNRATIGIIWPILIFASVTPDRVFVRKSHDAQPSEILNQNFSAACDQVAYFSVTCLPKCF